MEARPRLRSGPGLRAQASGARGEDLAESYLRSLGYTILGRNFKTRSGEIDIIAKDFETTVFVEVKQRESESHGRPEDFVPPSKRRRVISAARLYAAQHRLSERPLRFDVVAIHLAGGTPDVRHYRGAFDAS